MHDDVPGNVAAVMVQQTGDADAAIDAAPHRLELDLAIERSASMPLEGKGVLARWDADDQSLLVHTSTQTSTSVRQAIAAKLGLPVDRVEVVTPDVGGGFGVKIVHPWPEEVLVPVGGATARAAGEVDRGPPRALRLQRPRARPAAPGPGRVRRRGPAARALGAFWHDNGAYIAVRPDRADHHQHPAARARTSPGAYRVEFHSLYTNTVIVTPYRGAGRPQGCFVMERVMDAIAADLGLDRTVVRERNFIRPEEMPYDHGLVFQDGRPLVYDSGDFPASLAKLKAAGRLGRLRGVPRRRRAPRGARVGIGLACYVEGTGVGPYEGGHIRVETDGSVVVSTGLTSQGQGHQTMLAQIVADELGVPFDSITVTTGDTRRFKYAVGTFASRTAVMSGSAVALTARKVRREGAGDRRPGARGAPSTTSRSSTGTSGSRAPPIGASAIDLGAVAVLSNPLRYAFDEAAGAGHPVRRAGRPEQPPVARGSRPGWRAPTTTRRRARRSPTACTRSSSRPTRRPPRSRSCATASSTTAAR